MRNLIVLILIFFKMQPYNLSSLKIIGVIIVSFLAASLLPHFNNIFVAMAIKTTVICGIYLGLTYFLKIVPEFHKYIPFHKEK